MPRRRKLPIMENSFASPGHFMEQRLKRSPLERLALNGFRECAASKRLLEKCIWTLVMVASYTIAIYLAITTVNRYFEAGLVVDVQEHPKPSFRFPDVMVCPAASFNKTFFNSRIKIPASVEPEFTKQGVAEDEILHEFAKYLKYFNPSSANTAGDFENWKWDLLTKIYDYNFVDQEFSDFISDAAFRGREIFKKCEYEGRPYSCAQAQVVADTPSCYSLLIEGRRVIVESPRLDTARVQGLNFELSLPSSDVFYDFDGNDDYETKQLGAYLYMSNMPSPLSPPLTFPGNTHAMVELQSAEVRLMSDCFHDPPPVIIPAFSESFYSRDMCLFDHVQYFAKFRCNCNMVGGIHFPSNKDICTPTLMKNCVLPMLFNRDLTDYARVDEYCKPLCNDFEFWSTVSYYSIETANDSHITNRFTIFYHSKRQFLHSERSARNWYEIWSNVGGLVGVYTGASVAGVVQAIILLSPIMWKAMKNWDFLRSRFTPSHLPIVIPIEIKHPCKIKVRPAEYI